MIEQLSDVQRLNNNIHFRETEEQINKILLLLHQQLEKTGRDLLEQLSTSYAHQYDVAFQEGFCSAIELAIDLLKIRCSHNENGE